MYPLILKSEALNTFVKFKIEVEKYIAYTIKTL
jgi:hypothetical protein